MRLVIGLCAVALSAAVARADEPNVSQSPSSAAVQARVPLRVATLLPETNQALLFDVHQGTHVLVGVGATIAGYRVEGITRDAVILSAPGAHLVLTSDQGGRAPHAAGPATSTPPTPLQPAGTQHAPEDPYAASATATVDASRSFTAGQGGVRVVEAPDAAPDAQPVPSVTIDASVPAAAAPVRDLPVPVTASGTLGAPDASSPPPALDASAPAAVPPVETVPPPPVLDATVATPPAPAPPVPSPAPSLADEFATAMTGAPPTALAPSPPLATSPTVEPAMSPPATSPPPTPPPAASPPATSPAPPVTIRRAALAAALADFGQLATMLRAKLTPAGARLELVAPASVFGQAGLATGDVVTAVNGLPLRTLDDAAELYARASTAAGATIQVLRGGQPVTLRVEIE